jgi:hypothetical protein
MKNLSERENNDIFVGLYNLIYELSVDELNETQIILIDSEFFKPKDDYEYLDLQEVHMTLYDQKYPRLIPYYYGP